MSYTAYVWRLRLGYPDLIPINKSIKAIQQCFNPMKKKAFYALDISQKAENNK